MWPNVVLGMAGIGTSSWAVHVHRLAKAGEDTGCSITPTLSCDKVLMSKYAEIFGIPLGVYGLAFFVFVIVSAIATKNTKSTPRQFALMNLAVASLGFFSSLALLFISMVLIKVTCPVCLTTHATNSLLFGFSVWAYLRARKTA